MTTSFITRSQAIGYRHNHPVSVADALIADHIDLPILGPHDLLFQVEAV
ncbi:hypothetical protein [Corynebacterium flavescens]|nr:hypothetical protein [Corynebacterium flavescens]MDN6430774.1 hypothetical protein [Corynebacterium flavescens]MDN6475223.1 hypothetical protein [Corynebacterium flavescens]MDN6601660.1 hypothetical protein [Corynebacterium flavescens]MDN6822661.1 hypothetical protein [Corynebacterium flavescens]